MANLLTLNIDAQNIATLTLNKPERHNAFDGEMVGQFIQLLETIGKNDSIRLVILRAEGKSFCAGADLSWMRHMATVDAAQNHQDSLRLAGLLAAFDALNKPVIGVIQGASFGLGVGLVSCCDIAIASDSAIFSLSEVRLGLIPAVISPYVIAAIGARSSRRYFVSGERFDAAEALRIGLVHQICDPQSLDASVTSVINEILKGGPKAQSAAKDLIHHVSRASFDQDLLEETANRIATIRATAEGKEGLDAFLNKRKANWHQSNAG